MGQWGAWDVCGETVAWAHGTALEKVVSMQAGSWAAHQRVSLAEPSVELGDSCGQSGGDVSKKFGRARAAVHAELLATHPCLHSCPRSDVRCRSLSVCLVLADQGDRAEAIRSRDRAVSLAPSAANSAI